MAFNGRLPLDVQRDLVAIIKYIGTNQTSPQITTALGRDGIIDFAVGLQRINAYLANNVFINIQSLGEAAINKIPARFKLANGTGLKLVNDDGSDPTTAQQIRDAIKTLIKSMPEHFAATNLTNDILGTEITDKDKHSWVPLTGNDTNAQVTDKLQRAFKPTNESMNRYFAAIRTPGDPILRCHGDHLGANLPDHARTFEDLLPESAITPGTLDPTYFDARQTRINEILNPANDNDDYPVQMQEGNNNDWQRFDNDANHLRNRACVFSKTFRQDLQKKLGAAWQLAPQRKQTLFLNRLYAKHGENIAGFNPAAGGHAAAFTKEYFNYIFAAIDPRIKFDIADANDNTFDTGNSIQEKIELAKVAFARNGEISDRIAALFINPSFVRRRITTPATERTNQAFSISDTLSPADVQERALKDFFEQTTIPQSYLESSRTFKVQNGQPVPINIPDNDGNARQRAIQNAIQNAVYTEVNCGATQIIDPATHNPTSLLVTCYHDNHTDNNNIAHQKNDYYVNVIPQKFYDYIKIARTVSPFHPKINILNTPNDPNNADHQILTQVPTAIDQDGDATFNERTFTPQQLQYAALMSIGFTADRIDHNLSQQQINDMDNFLDHYRGENPNDRDNIEIPPRPRPGMAP
jgi:hypothetical protein